ncbi:MAG: transposase [Candidatus Moduliflexus flocculans]|nr:transposase [Candidatus Moduliflexus flocculans]
MTELLENICKASMVQDIEILTSIKGINTKTAIPFLAELSAIERFDSYKKLIAYAGMDPAIYNSGKRQASGKISKRGNSHLRRVIWLMTFCTVRQNPIMKAYFLKRIREGLPFKKAMMATSHKLIRLIYAMLTRKTYYVAQISNA